MDNMEQNGKFLVLGVAAMCFLRMRSLAISLKVDEKQVSY